MTVQITLADEKLTVVMEALQHASMSNHHPSCSQRKTNHCDCHVQKAKNGLAIVKTAVAAAA